MAKKLIVCESPGKISKIHHHAGQGFDVTASFGHIFDLPPKKFGVDLKTFEPEIVVLPDKTEVLKTIRNKIHHCDAIYLMTDEDREGCGIAANLYDNIKDLKKPVYRAKTNEITAKGIANAIQNATSMDADQSMVDAYLARRILDRIAGYRTSFITQQATGGRSAGRVQSAILRIIVEREKEIIHFVPEEYWVLTAYLLSSKNEPFVATLEDTVKVPNEKTAQSIYDSVSKGKPVVKSIEAKEVKSNPYPPMTTLPMVAAASTLYGWPAAKTMEIAQSLYTQGHCTYHRTDAPFLAAEALASIRAYISSNYGSKYLPSKPNVYAAKKGAQEAHEACRPTDVNATPHLMGDEQKLYDLIWRRAVASQMTPGVDERVKVITDIAKYDFVSRGNRQLFDGHRKVWHFSSSEDTILPLLKEGENCSFNAAMSGNSGSGKTIHSKPGLVAEQRFTQPPPRYSDASLSKKCETEQIARPATFGNFLKVLQERGYISRKNKAFTATELGINVIDFLVASNICFVDVGFTAEMETKLDKIQEKTLTREQVLSEFWTRLKGDLQNCQKVKNESQKTAFTCPKCQGVLLKKHSKFGSFYSCENYKKDGGCPYTAKIGEDGQPVEKQSNKIEYLDFVCKNCGAKMIKRTSKYGEFAGCSGYPKCKTTASLEGEFKESTGKTTKFKKYKKKSHGNDPQISDAE